jgi:hypothetical protein
MSVSDFSSQVHRHFLFMLEKSEAKALEVENMSKIRLFYNSAEIIASWIWPQTLPEL